MKNTISKILKNKFFWIVILITLTIIVFLFLKRETPPQVVNTDPRDGEENILEIKQISINMNTNISDSTKENVSVSFTPDVQFDSTWLTNTYRIIPQNNLLNNTDYVVKVNYKNKEIYRFTFETSVFSQKDIKEYGAIQSQDDYVYGQALKNVVNEYPFYTSLPIKTQNYVIYYDFEQGEFAITLLVATENVDQKDEIIKDALENIRKIGVEDPILYYINEHSEPSQKTTP